MTYENLVCAVLDNMVKKWFSMGLTSVTIEEIQAEVNKVKEMLQK